jgi:hypothetical protein
MKSIIIRLILIIGLNADKVPQFCDYNYVDSVVYNGDIYKVTRNEWIADYNDEEKTVEKFEYMFKEHGSKARVILL